MMTTRPIRPSGTSATVRLANTALCLAAMLVIIVSSTAPVSAQDTTNDRPIVVPQIRSWTGRTGTFTLASTSSIIIDSAARSTESTVHGITTTIAETASNLGEDLLALTGLRITATTAAAPTAEAGDIVLSLLNSEDSTIGNEGYNLTIGDSVTIAANTTAGIFYGGQTILQILGQSQDMRTLPKGVATDYPTKFYRGVMLDMGRKYWEMDYLEGLIQEMGWYKLNVFHAHFTESEGGFRLDSPNFPGLEHSSGSYDREDIDRLQTLAKKNHVVIIPEIDMPGHATAIVQYYNRQNPGEELGFTHSTCLRLNRGLWGNEPNWSINFANSRGRGYAKTLLSEFAPWFDGPYFHIGADEAYFNTDMERCQEIREFAQANGLSDNGDVLPHFINEMNAHVKTLGKELAIWNGYEHSASARTAVDTDVVVYLWDDDEIGGRPDGPKFIADGFDLVYTRRNYTGLTMTPLAHTVNNAFNLYLVPWIHRFPTEGPFYSATLSTSDDWRGYQISVWADSNSRFFADDTYEVLLDFPRVVLAEKLWTNPSGGTIGDLRTRRLAVGHPIGSSLVRVHSGIAKDDWTVHSVTAEYSGDEGTNAFDRRIDTMWRPDRTATSASPVNLDIDLGKTYDITQLQYVPRSYEDYSSGQGVPRDRAGNYEFFVSTDGRNWGTKVASGMDSSGEAKIATHVLSSPARGRYLRFRITSARTTGRWVSVAEINVHGAFVGAPLPPTPDTYEDSLITHWDFEEGSGTTANDEEGSRDGTISGASWITGVAGSYALRFDGTDDYMQVGSSDITTDWTVAVWVRRYGTNSQSILHGSRSTLKLVQYNSTEHRVGYTRNSYSIGATYVQGEDHEFSYTAPLNTWVYLVFMRRGSDMELYADGRLVSTESGDSVNLPLTRFGANSPGSDYSHADYDDVRIYNAALSADNIAHLYSSYSSNIPAHACPGQGI